MKRKIALLLATLMVGSLSGCNIAYESELESTGDSEIVSDAQVVIDFCYTNEAYKEYFEFCEKEFEKRNDKVDIILHCQTENLEYLDDIANTTYTEDSFMDVYMLSDSNIATAYLAGVAAKNTFDVFSEENYCKTALNACSYGDVLVGYPLSYDTTFFVYRSDLLSGDAVKTYYDLKLFSDEADYSAEEYMMIESIFKCDITDIYNVYGFIGDGINIGGDSGSDATEVDVYNEKTARLAEEYMALLEYFSINMNEEYDDILAKLLEGKYISTIASTSSLDKIYESELPFEIEEIPNYSAALETAPLSITQCVVVNLYSPHNAVASDFARFVTYEAASYMYDMSSKLSARRIDYEDDNLEKIYISYEKASIKNKLQYGEQFYPLVEIAMHNIAAGNPVEDELTNVQEHMKNQLN